MEHRCLPNFLSARAGEEQRLRANAAKRMGHHGESIPLLPDTHSIGYYWSIAHTSAKTACLSEAQVWPARTRLGLKRHVDQKKEEEEKRREAQRNNFFKLQRQTHNAGVVSAPQTATSSTEEPLLSFWRQTHMVRRDDACSMQQHPGRWMDGWMDEGQERGELNDYSPEAMPATTKYKWNK